MTSPHTPTPADTATDTAPERIWVRRSNWLVRVSEDGPFRWPGSGNSPDLTGTEYVRADLAASLPRAEAGDGWQPMETAPRRGEDVLVWSGEQQMVAFWDGDYWRFATNRNGDGIGIRTPKLWRPLLPSPCEAPPAPSEAMGAREAALRARILAILDGDMGFVLGEPWDRETGARSKHDRCVHGRPRYDDCGSCLDAALRLALAPPEPAAPQGGTPPAGRDGEGAGHG